MKRIFYALLLVSLLTPFAASVRGQSTAGSIDSITVDLWPDYDRAAVLVLITGELPADTALPADVTVPLPDSAEFNVVARIDASDGRMKDDIEFRVSPGEVSFITPDLRFRVEYYFPYSAVGNQRSFNFTWLAETPVNQFRVSVQQPSAADSLLTEPASIDTITGDDGFLYHSLPIQVIPAGQAFSVRVDYTMSGSELSVQRSGPSITDAGTTGFSPTETTSEGIDWPVIVAAVGGVLIIMVITWQVATTRASSRPRKPRPVRAQSKRATATTPHYCHICGQPVQQGDKFCRECGTAVQAN
jgi:hypothetical protein